MPLNTCKEAAIMATSVVLKVLYGIKIVTLCTAIIIVLWFWKRRGIKWLVHPNTKLFWVVHISATLLFSVAQFPAITYELVRISSIHQNPCDYQLPLALAFIIQSIIRVSQTVMQLAMLLLALERCFSTIFPIIYEKIVTATFAIICSIFAVIFALSMGALILCLVPDWNVRLSKLSMYSTDSTTILAILTVWSNLQLAILITTVGLFSGVLVWNYLLHKSMLKSRNAKLGNRYQIVENQRITFLILPVFAINLVLNLLNSFGFMSVRPMLRNTDIVSRSILVEGLSQIHLYAIFMPLLLEYRLRKHRNSVVDQSSHTDHFKQIDEMFS